MAFDPTPHLVKVKGGQLYLPVKDRLIWLREEHPDAAIATEMVHLDLELQLAIFRAQVTVPNRGSATGYGSETERDEARPLLGRVRTCQHEPHDQGDAGRQTGVSRQ